jgi:hypothetical protein
MGGDIIVRIEKLSNGFEVEIRDQKQVAKNDKPTPGYKDPWCSYAFKTTAEVCKFLEANLDKAAPADDFNSSFDAAAAEDNDEDD